MAPILVPPLPEAIEQAGQMIAVDPAAGVRHREQDFARIHHCAQRDLSAWFGELDRIAQEVFEHLKQPVVVGPEVRKVRLCIEPKRERPLRPRAVLESRAPRKALCAWEHTPAGSRTFPPPSGSRRRVPGSGDACGLRHAQSRAYLPLGAHLLQNCRERHNGREGIAQVVRKQWRACRPEPEWLAWRRLLTTGAPPLIVAFADVAIDGQPPAVWQNLGAHLNRQIRPILPAQHPLADIAAALQEPFAVAEKPLFLFGQDAGKIYHR